MIRPDRPAPAASPLARSPAASAPARPFAARRLAQSLLCLALLAALPLACQDDASRLAEHMARGEQALEDEKPNEAVIEYRNAL